MSEDWEARVARLERRLERERKARLEAETIAEKGLRDLYERQQQLKLLQNIAVAANQSSSVTDAFRFALKTVCAYAGWPVGHVYMVEERPSQRLISTSVWHEVNGFNASTSFREATEAMFMATAVGLPGRVLSSGEPAWVPDLAQDANFPRAEIALGCGLRSGAAFPVLVGSQVAAVLEFFSKHPLPVDPELLDVMGQIGVQLGRVIERRRSEDQLIYDASHDSLTGLANRALFRDRLNHAIAWHRRSSSRNFAVLFIDLDHFKLVNDSLGHAAGDEVIVEIGRRLQAALRDQDCIARDSGDVAEASNKTLARLGGDEFTVLIEDIGSPADPIRVAERIQSAIRQPLKITGQDIYAGASIGLAYSENGYATPDEVLRDADLAMYRAKASGRGGVEIFDIGMHQSAVKRLRLESDLRRAVQEGQFVLHFQPIISLHSSEITGFEALVRWQKSPTELVLPGDFIQVAEETGLIVLIGHWVLRQVCQTIREWRARLPAEVPLTVSVNISPRQFAQPDFIHQVKRAVTDAHIDPSSLRIEVTEGVTIGNADRAIGILQELREFGIRTAVDDFGTGYSSLSYLQRLPLDVLKIDRSFVLAMGHDPGSRQIVESILNLARGLGMDVVAEGAESARHVFDLQAMGCQYGQGYFFSKPVSAQAAFDLLYRGPLSAAAPWPIAS